MDIIFSRILNMSFSASFVIAGVLLLRILLKKAPRKYSCFLWLLVFFRLLCPVTMESVLSLIPVRADAICYQSGTSISGSTVKIQTGIDAVDQVTTRGIQKAGATLSGAGKVNVLGNLFSLLLLVWAAGVLVLLLHAIVKTQKLKSSLRTAVLIEGKTRGCCPVYESDRIDTAFLIGLFRPRIYLPLGLAEERSYVLTHERMHKKRLDHIIKPVCYLGVVLHWFNPLVWLAFSLMTKDMEMACDEQVLKSAATDIRGAYSRSLLNLSVQGGGLSVPLAFGETSTKARIRHALNYKKPSTWAGIGAVLVIVVAAVVLLTTRGGGDGGTEGLEHGDKKTKVVSGEELYEQLSANRNPYIGDHVANGRLIGLLPSPVCYEGRGMELQTSARPYGLILRYEKVEPITVRQEQENASLMMENAIWLFSTIENMDVCTFCLDVPDSAGSEVTYSREELEAELGKLYEKSETPEGLKALEQAIAAYEERMGDYLKSTYDPKGKEQDSFTEEWAGITVDGVDEALFWKDVDISTMEEIALELQTLAEEIVEKQREDPDSVLRGDWMPDIKKSARYEKVLGMGKRAMKPLYAIIYKSEQQGLYEYICSMALEKLSGYDFTNEDGYRWATSKEFLEQLTQKIIQENK